MPPQVPNETPRPGLDLSRFATLSPSDAALSRTIGIVGCGGLGSFTAEMLARMGCLSFRLIDYDIVEPPNVATQNFCNADCSAPKVDALGGRLASISTGITVTAVQSRIEDISLEDAIGNVVISSVDSIEVRQAIYRKVLEESTEQGIDTLLVDPRMGLESLEVNAIRVPAQLPEDLAYRECLFDAAQTYSEDPCGSKAIAYTGAFVAGVIGPIIRRHLRGLTIPHRLFGDLGSHGFRTYWPKGRAYTPELDDYGAPITAAPGRGRNE